MNDSILTIHNKKDEKFLRTPTAEFDFAKFTKKETSNLLVKMRAMMREAKGVGLSANQIGLNMRLFVAEVPSTQGDMKFYAVFNPTIEKTGGEKILMEEGCLSVPRTYGYVERYERVTLSGWDKNAKPIKIKAWGLLAHVFQHEIDHLNGKLFIDKARNVYETPTTDRLAEREKNMESGS